MKKRKIVISLMLISLFLFAQAGFAFESETYLMNEDGNKITEGPSIETGSNVDLGKIRIREDAYTIGSLESGDRIAIILTNASFVEPPKVLNPPESVDNRYGETGDFNLVKVANTGRKGDNAVVYELQKKTTFISNYRRLDYVIHLGDIKVETEGNVYVHVIAGTQDDNQKGQILKHEQILLAKAYTVVPDSISKNDYIKHEVISRDLNTNFENSSIYRVSEKNMVFEMPKKFFQQGDMLGTLNDERWTFRLVVNEAAGMRVANPAFSTSIGAPIREMKFYKVDAFGNYSTVLAQKNFEPVKVTFRNLNPTSTETTKFVAVKYVENTDGTYTKELAGSGSYNHINKEYTFYVNGPGIYSVEKKEATNITMRVNDFFASVNNIQNRLDAAPQVINSSTYVPIRFIAENLGAEVEFLADTNQVQIKTSEKTIYLPIDKVTAELATPARIIEGRTMVPVRYVSEQLGAVVSYFADTRTIEIIK
jgi:hypothetical protein